MDNSNLYGQVRDLFSRKPGHRYHPELVEQNIITENDIQQYPDLNPILIGQRGVKAHTSIADGTVISLYEDIISSYVESGKLEDEVCGDYKCILDVIDDLKPLTIDAHSRYCSYINPGPTLCIMRIGLYPMLGRAKIF